MSAAHTATPQWLVEAQAKAAQIIASVKWIDGKYYAIGDASEPCGTYPLFKCIADDGSVFLGEEDACGEISDYKSVDLVVCSRDQVVPQ